MRHHKTTISFFFIILVLLVPAQAIIPSAEDAATKADETIYRRIPFTFECDYCHANGTAANVKVPHHTNLELHDNLVLEGQVGCFICHDFFQRDKLMLLSGELVSFNDSAKLCYQCHEERYDTWLFGDHGKSINELDLSSTIANKSVEELEQRRFRCSDFRCHNPHSPRLYKVGLGRGYPLPPPLDPPKSPRLLGPSNDEPYYETVIATGKVFIMVITIVLLISAFMFMAYQGKE